MRKKRRNNKISILIVPEDNVEPYSFRLRTKWVKVAYVVGILLVAHIVVGAFFYWKYAQELSKNKQLRSLNSQLKEDNKRVLSLANQFYALEKDYQKVRTLLGIDSEHLPEVGGRYQASESSVQLDKIVPVKHTNIRPSPKTIATKKRYILSPKKNKMHEYADDVPTLLPVEGFMTQDFRKKGWFLPKNHTGIDIVAKKGSIIRAAGSGIIIFSNWTFDLGNLIIIDHGNGILSYYGHNQRLLKGEKNYVKKGEPIALLGSSGKSSGPHLHFEIWKDGLPVDPKEYIVAFQEK
ncbi:MAG: M23 family metallopeptidase [bacterium]